MLIARGRRSSEEVGAAAEGELSQRLVNKQMVLPFVPPRFPSAASHGDALIKPSEYLRSLGGVKPAPPALRRQRGPAPVARAHPRSPCPAPPRPAPRLPHRPPPPPPPPLHSAAPPTTTKDDHPPQRARRRQ
ncbi:espin-like, partial [Gryllus bimaculatus]